MKVGIINTVPLNGGDEMLLNEAIALCRKKWSKCKFSFFTNNQKLIEEYSELNNLPGEFFWDLEYVSELISPYMFTNQIKKRYNLRKRLSQKFKINYHGFLLSLFSCKDEYKTKQELKSCDIILSSAGGYINERYGYSNRLKTIKIISSQLNKKVVLLPMSVEVNKENYGEIKDALNKCIVFARESLTYELLQSIGLSNAHLWTDLAISSSFTQDKHDKPQSQKIIINIRNWKYGNNSDKTVEKYKRLITKLTNQNYHITIVSTCQGVNGYVDDSIEAQKVISQLNNKVLHNVNLIKDKMSIPELSKLIQQHDAVLGMRMHLLILSLSNAIPVFQISYELKSTAIFKDMGLEDFESALEDPYNIWENKVMKFLNHYQTSREEQLVAFEHMKNKFPSEQLLDIV